MIFKSVETNLGFKVGGQQEKREGKTVWAFIMSLFRSTESQTNEVKEAKAA